MAFQVARTAGQQISPTFAEGYPYPNKFANMGQLMSPWEGKPMGVSGDYGPPQSTTRYTVDNPVSVYPLDQFFNSDIHLPIASRCCDNPQYPWKYIPGNYFAPLDVNYPDMKKVKSSPYFNTYPLGTHPDFHINDNDFPSYKSRMGKKETYEGCSRADGSDNQSGYHETDMLLYRRLPTAPGPMLNNANYYPPFNNFY
jgi:hypothetical protein